MRSVRSWVVLCVLGGVAAAAPPKSVVVPRPEARAEAKAEAKLDERALTADIRFLSDDLLEGRAPATRGDELAMRYVATQMERLGLQPLGDAADGERSYIQRFPLVGLRPRVTVPPVIRGKRGAMHLAPGEDAILVSGVQQPRAVLKDAPLVFVGFGIVAPEEHWDDYAGVDVRGKVVVILNNDPSVDPKRFGGVTRLFYGRWDYKYAEAARHGAAGAIIIHTTPSAGYPWQVVQTSWSRTTFELPAGDEPRLQMRMWVTEQRARDILALAGVGESLDALSARAERPGFRALPLDAKMSAELAIDVERVETGNVLGLLPGSDPTVAEQYLVVTAHHDHLGRRHLEEAAAKRDHQGHAHDDIYNGALDNASGVAALLELATALADSHPRRGVLFAAVGAEESGLLGSQWLCAHLPVPAGELTADLNIDGVDIWGRTHDLTFVGLGKSTLDDVVRAVAAEQGRVVVPDQFPDRGSFYRSDQLSFARVGVPSIYLSNGIEFPGHDAAWGRARVDEYVKSRYHQTSDELDSTWKLDGAIEDLRLETRVLLRVANARAQPTWRPGDEFEAARKGAPK